MLRNRNHRIISFDSGGHSAMQCPKTQALMKSSHPWVRAGWERCECEDP